VEYWKVLAVLTRIVYSADDLLLNPWPPNRKSFLADAFLARSTPCPFHPAPSLRFLLGHTVPLNKMMYYLFEFEKNRYSYIYHR